MSGPKVLEIVTRQEILEICQAYLAEIDAAIADWQRIAERNNLKTGDDLTKVRLRKQEVTQLLAADRFNDVQKQAPLVAEWVRQDIASKVEQQYLAGLKSRDRERSLHMAASALIVRCRDMQVELPPELSSLLADAETQSAEHKQQLERGISRVLRILDALSTSQTARRQSEIAKTLGASGIDQSLDGWIAENASPQNDSRISVIERQLAQLAALDALDSSQEITARWEAICVTSDKRHRDVLVDSFSLELAASLREANHMAELRRLLVQEKSAVQAAGDLVVFGSMIAQIESNLSQRNLQGVREQLDRMRELRVSRRQERVAESGRQAILRGLKDLGYDVREGMSNAWTTKKRLVVRHTSKPGVALEIGGDAATGRLQTRMVALQGVTRNVQSDKQVEEQWCEELGRLQASLVAAGGSIHVEKATAAGVQPLKVIPDQCRAIACRSRARFNNCFARGFVKWGRNFPET